MSIRVHDAYILKNCSFTELLALCQEFKKKAKKIQKMETHRYLANRYYYQNDRSLIFNDEESKPLKIIEIIEEFSNRSEASKKTNKRDPVVDYGISAVFFPYKKDVLAMFFFDNHCFNKVVKGFYKDMSDYSYYNNSDRPKEVSKAQWKKREVVWESVLNGYGSPSGNGFEFIFTDTSFYLYPEEVSTDLINALVPAKEDRIRHLIELYEGKEFYKKNPQMFESGNFDWGLYGETKRSWKASEEYKNLVLKWTAEINKKIPEFYELKFKKS